MVMIDRIVELRRESGLSVQQFEISVQVPNGSLGSWIKGKYKPSLDAIIGIAKFCNVATDYLLGLSDVRRVENSLSAYEQLLVESYRMADENGQQEIICTCRIERRKAESGAFWKEGGA